MSLTKAREEVSVPQTFSGAAITNRCMESMSMVETNMIMRMGRKVREEGIVVVVVVAVVALGLMVEL